MDDPHYYSYQYEVKDKTKEFVVRAFGDLDCDGEYSTFEMIGSGGETLKAPTLTVTKELE